MWEKMEGRGTAEKKAVGSGVHADADDRRRFVDEIREMAMDIEREVGRASRA